MKEELIKYKTAILAKEGGIDEVFMEYVSNWYSKDGTNKTAFKRAELKLNSNNEVSILSIKEDL